jgi:transcriptional regulator with XRE-family HTH domain
MSKSKTFGALINKKRLAQKVSLRKIATQIGISPVYLCEMENGKKTNPSNEILQKMITVLCLNDEETSLFYDLHAKVNGIVSQDLSEYIMESDIIRKILRTAKKKPATDEDWQVFINKIE